MTEDDYNQQEMDRWYNSDPAEYFGEAPFQNVVWTDADTDRLKAILPNVKKQPTFILQMIIELGCDDYVLYEAVEIAFGKKSKYI